MKRHIVFLAMLIGICNTSCTTHFFTEPQPVGVQSTDKMPEPIMGEWKSLDMNETHIIDKNRWIRKSADSLGIVTTKVEQCISDSLIIKKVGKLYFVNTLEDGNLWTVYLGQSSGNFFYIKGLGEADTLILKTSLGIVPDSTANSTELYYKQNLTKKQIKKLVKNGGFADTLMVFDLKNRTLKN